MPSKEVKEKDPLSNVIVSIVSDMGISRDDREKIPRIVDLMLVAFRTRLNQNIYGGFIKDGRVWEERLKKFVDIYECIPSQSRPVITDILRGVVKEKIERDKERI